MYFAVNDMERSIEFYSRLFRKAPVTKSEYFAEFGLGEMRLGLLHVSRYGHPLVRGNNCVPTIEVQNIEVERTRIQRLTERVVGEVRSVGLYDLFEFTDPDGNVLEFYSTTNSSVPLPNGEQSAFVQVAANKAVDDWFEDYVERIYGVNPRDDRSTVKNMPAHHLSFESLAERLDARFNELDLVPKDGLVSYLEVERAITNPLLHWDETDIAMLKLLRRYYHSLIELSDDEKERMDQGISRHDVEALLKGIDEKCKNFRRLIDEEHASELENSKPGH